MSQKRKTLRTKLRGGFPPATVRTVSTALKHIPLTSFRPRASRMLPTAGLVNPQMLAPPIGVRFSSGLAGMRSRPVVGVGELGRKERMEAKSEKLSLTTDKTLYSADTFPILERYTAHQIMKINPRSRLGCYKLIFQKAPEFPFANDQEFLQGFFADLKAAGKLVLNGDGIDPNQLSSKVNISPDATELEGYEAAQTIVPALSVVAGTLKTTAEIIPEKIYPATLTQQVSLFLEEYAPIRDVVQIFLNAGNISQVSSYLGYEPSANIFKKANEDLYRVFAAGIQDGFDVKAFKSLFTPSRISKLKSGILNLWAKGDKQVAFQNLDKLILCVKYGVFTEMSLDGYLSTLNTNPKEALSELNTIYEESRKYERKLEEAPELEKIKSQTWHWYKYTTQGKIAGILAVIVLMLAMFGIYSVYDAQKEMRRLAFEHEVEKKLQTRIDEMKIIGQSVQGKAIEPLLEALKPATEPVSKSYENFTANARRKQYLFYRWYNAIRNRLSSKPPNGGTRKLRKN